MSATDAKNAVTKHFPKVRDSGFAILLGLILYTNSQQERRMDYFQWQNNLIAQKLGIQLPPLPPSANPLNLLGSNLPAAVP